MDKKFIATRNLNRDLKNTATRYRIPDYTNEKHFSSAKVKQVNYYRPQHRGSYYKRSLEYHSESVSLSNEEYIHATSQIWLDQKCLKSDYDFDDIYSQWDSIIQINFYKTEDIVCPICMDAPKVCRTDKCGHVYCFPCLNKFLSYENGYYKKCALCNQEIDLKRVKRAAFIERFSLNVGDNISLLLMRRSKSDSFPVPINLNEARIPYVYSNESRFSNTAVCSNEDLQTLIQIDIIALEDELGNAIVEESDNIDAITAALEATRNELELSCLLPHVSKPSINNSSVIEIDDLNLIMKTDNVYYQSEDGSNLFMCPLNWKCMSYEFLDKNQCLPLRITGEIIEIEKFTITSDFVNRYRYLKYLPIGSSVSFVEINLTNIISNSTLRKFKNEIDRKSDNRHYREQLDNALTTEKIKQENSFNVASGFMCVTSLMNETNHILDDDFVPLSPTVPTSSHASNVNVLSDKKMSYAELMHLKKPPVNYQSRAENSSDATGETQARGFSLQDCLVKKSNKRNRKK